MPVASSQPKVEALWRESWLASPFVGEVELVSEGGVEKLIIRCEEVAAEHGSDAEILDDGRTVGVSVGDQVAFAAVERKRKAPIAVNVWRTNPKESGVKRKKRKVVEFEEEPENAGENWEDSGHHPDLPDKLRGELTGIVRNQSSSSGHYFVENGDIYEAYERDATIKLYDMPRDVGIGDAVTFKLVAPNHVLSAPKATNVRKASPNEAKQAFARGFRKGGGHKGGEKGKGKGKPKGEPAFRSGWGGRGPSMRMLGIVKQTSMHTGRHFILCQDISDVYKKDAQIPPEEVPDGMKVGDRIAFDVDEPPDGSNAVPLARNVKILGKAGRGKNKPVVEDGLGDGEDGAEGEEAAVEEDDDEEWEAEETGAGAEQNADDGELDLAEGADTYTGVEADVTEAAGQGDDNDEEPDSVEGWVKAQKRLFSGLPKCPKGWIRIRSKSRGLVYFYNVDDGRSQPDFPSC